MISDWIRIPLSELTESETPITYGVVKPGEEDPNGVRFVRGGDIANGQIRIEQLRTISCDISYQYQRTLLKGGEILISLVGNPGQTAIVPDSLKGANIARQVGLIRLKRDVDTRFVNYSLTSKIGQEALGAQSLGSVQQVINLRDLKTVCIPLPPLPIQHAIARILGSLDDKIELNRQMNETLEAMARAIFQSWFVDFDPVRAKAEGHDTGLPPEVAALFPSEMVEVDGREVPKGWVVERLPEVVEINPKRSLAKDDVAPYLDMQNVPTRGHRPIDWIMRAFGSGTKFVNGDTLLARITPCLENGKTIFVDFLEDGQVGWGSTEYIVLRPKSPLPTEFGYILARDEDFRAHAILNMSGSSGRQRVPSECFDSYQIVVPSKDIARQFGELVKPLMAKIKANDEQARTLAQIRDVLLPRLMSGGIQLSP